MTKFLKKAALGFGLIASTMAVYAPAQAQDYNYRHDRSTYHGDRGYRGHAYGRDQRGYHHSYGHHDWQRYGDRHDHRRGE